MAKSIKITLISVLTAIFALCIAAVAFPTQSAKADTIEVTTTGINDGNFSFVPGAYIPKTLFEEDPNGENFDLKTARTQLRFDFKLENFDYENLADSVPHAHPWFSSSLASPNVFIYEFTLLRGNHDGDGAGNLMTADEQYSVLVVIFPDAHKNFYGYVAIKDFYTNNLLISNGYAGGFLNGTYISNNSQKDYDNIATDGDYYNYDGVRRYFGKGYKITYKFRLANNNLAFSQDNGLKLSLVANINSPFQYYCIRARYCYNISHDSMSNTRTIAYGEIYSSSRSLAKCLQNAQDAGYDFNDLLSPGRAEWAEKILAVDNTTRVRIKYLAEIEGTPYATHNYDYVNVPILEETIYIDDVEAALGRSLRKCCDSNAYCFQKTTDTDGEVYQLYYLKNVWLRSVTVDGNYFDYFLDINESYKEIYRPYVEAGILTNDVYEWIYSTQMLNKFPALQNYRFNEIYG